MINTNLEETDTKTISDASGLSELCELLNAIPEDDVDVLEYADLPIFGNREVKNTSEVWSWDDTHILVAGTEERWTTEPRCVVCGEAIFHCSCDQNGLTGESRKD